MRNPAVPCVLLAALAACTTFPDREAISTAAAPAAIGPYAQAVRVGRTVYLSGQLGLDPATGKLVAGGVEAETRQALVNCRAILAAAGLTLADVVQAQVFLADMNDYQAVNAIYAEHFPAAPPARAAVQVARLPRDGRVEILLTAVRTGR
jgi:2-iminobutanoate/2-iminopropanoate deaminase